MSLSARRAWIEIRGGYITKIDKDQSLSARRAWIEIIPLAKVRHCEGVALRKESVDRNVAAHVAVVPLKRRSPQGERG